MNTMPEILCDSSGTPITTAGGWQQNREAIKNLLSEQEYGFLPPAPDAISFQVTERDTDFCASKAVYERVEITVKIGERQFAFPVHAVVPKVPALPMAFVHVNFRGNVPDLYLPTEELVDGGMAVFSFDYQQVTADNGDFTNGLAALFFGHSPRTGSDPGKIALWAWACMRVMDYVCTRQDIDLKNVAIVGHSRLGKTALLAAAHDTRFAFVFANNSGCSGAAISRGKQGERVADITATFPFWFCENYQKYAGKEEAMPFDQHFLLSLIAPRHLYVSSAQDDLWADPQAELFGCRMASPVYALFGMPGLIGDIKADSTTYHGGTIGYHIRTGSHYLSRYDWQQFMAYMRFAKQ